MPPSLACVGREVEESVQHCAKPVFYLSTWGKLKLSLINIYIYIYIYILELWGSFGGGPPAKFLFFIFYFF